MSFADTLVMVDCRARATPSPRAPTKDAIFACVARDGASEHPAYFRTRAAAMAWLDDLIEDELQAGRRVLAGFDFALGYPAGFAAALTGTASVFAVWDWLCARIEDRVDNANNRFDVAAQINARFPGLGPFWGCPAHLCVPGLPHRGSERHGHGQRERRATEQSGRGAAQPVWKLYTTGAVGSQSLLGIPHLTRLRRRLGRRCQVWPQDSGAEQPTAPVVLCEIYPSLVRATYETPLPEQYPEALYHIADAEQVRAAVDCYAMVPRDRVDGWFAIAPSPPVHVTEEGWILGLAPDRVVR